MKRKFFAAILALIAIFALALSGCTSFTGIHTAYDKAGYVELEDISEYRGRIIEALGKNYEEVCNVHVFTKRTDDVLGLSDRGVAIIIEFFSEDEMEECIERSETLQELIGDVRKSDRVCGNCILLFAFGSDAATIFRESI